MKLHHIAMSIVICKPACKDLDLRDMSFYRPKRSFGQGNIFTGMCDSVHRGDLVPGGLQFFWGRCSIFRGEGAVSNFSGGLQFFGGSPIFQGGVSNFLGGGGVSNFLGGSPIFRGGLHRNTVNVRPVRILLECILVSNVN